MSNQIPYLEFKFLLNRRIDFGDGVEYVVPFKPYYEQTAAGEAMKANFDMEKVFRIELRDETAQIPVKRPGQSERAHQQKIDAAYAEVDQARASNDMVRKGVKEYVRTGVIEIVNDPFAEVLVPDVDEVPEAPKPAKVVKPKANAKKKPARKKKPAKRIVKKPSKVLDAAPQV